MIRKIVITTGMLALVIWQAHAQQKKASGSAAAKPAAGQHASPMADGKKVYQKYCLTCHQADGGGVQNMNPPLVGTSYVLGDKAVMIKIVLNGFKDAVEINGQTYSNTMASFRNLKDKEIADVLTYVRGSFTNKASAVTPAEVAAERGKGKLGK